MLALILDALGGAPVDVVTGDLGLVLAAIDALETSDARKAALRRHVWRPARFHALLHRFGDGHAAAQLSRAALLAAEARGEVPALVAAAGAAVGLRAAEEVEARAAHLAAEAATPPLAPEQVEGLEAVLSVEGSAGAALDALGGLARRFARARRGGRALCGAARRARRARGGERRAALRGELRADDARILRRFVFGALPRGRADLPPIASGGRYDALTRVLGRGRSIPAVGGIVRPEALLALGGGAWA